MLKVTLHAGSLAERNAFNTLATLDIAYADKKPTADYLVALSMAGVGETAPAFVRKYPRWSASLWELVARALAQALYRTDTPPSADKPDRRCAYATRLCAVIELSTVDSRGRELAICELAQTDRRGQYRATFDEDIMGERSAVFEYGCKRLNPADLLMRAICWALFGQDTPGPWPKLIIPPPLRMDGVDHFHIAYLSEPALTGFQRYMALAHPEAADEAMPLAAHYAAFLMRG